jgi:multidrug efflux pump subunit AcrA (membrane-fusion protein)
LRAQVAGRIDQIACNAADTVGAGAVLIEIVPSEVEERATAPKFAAGVIALDRSNPMLRRR